MVKFSIILPTYNSENTILRTLQSVLHQTWPVWELLIINDGSTDGTFNTIKPYLSDPRVKYFYQSNAGVSGARSKGIGNSEGGFIVFLDSDDEVKPCLLSDFAGMIQKNSSVGFVSSGLILNGEEMFPRLDRNISPYRYAHIPGTFAVNKDVLVAIKGYDINLRQSENWEMTGRALKYCEEKNLKILHINKCNLFYHHQKNPAQVRSRDEERAQATFYLHQKYMNEGIFHFRKDDFLLASAVNFCRAGKIKKSREIFYRIFKNDKSLKNFARILSFEIPFLRKQKWMR